MFKNISIFWWWHFHLFGALWVSKPRLGGQKTRKNVFFQYLEAKIVKIIYPWSVLKKTKRGSTFLIPIWGPRLSGSPESVIFDVIFGKSMDFHIKIASRGAPNRGPLGKSTGVLKLSFPIIYRVFVLSYLWISKTRFFQKPVMAIWQMYSPWGFQYVD